MFLDKFTCTFNPMLISNMSCKYVNKLPNNQISTITVDVNSIGILDALFVSFSHFKP